MDLSKKQFEILEKLATGKNLSQRQLKESAGFSLGLVNKIMQELKEKNAVENGRITEEGFSLLEPYRVRRAVFLAAGLGARLAPITFNTPKPLIRVKDRRIIDTLLDACYAAGIKEIYVVRGYLAEQFDQLLYKYPSVTFLENPEYNEGNNIGSAMAARDYLSNTFSGSGSSAVMTGAAGSGMALSAKNCWGPKEMMFTGWSGSATGTRLTGKN